MQNDTIRRTEAMRYFTNDPQEQYTVGQIVGVLDTLPTVDAVEVVRCRECRKWERYENTAGCGYCHNMRFRFEYGGDKQGYEFKPITEPDFSCMDGQRRGEENG